MGDGEILFLAVGTGLDVRFFPEGKSIIGIDISQKMLDQAKPRTDLYRGNLRVLQADVHDMPFEVGAIRSGVHVLHLLFGTQADRRFEGTEARAEAERRAVHVRTYREPVLSFRPMMNLMTLLSRKIGPDMNRPTVENVLAAGYQLKKVTHIYMDVVKTVHAVPV